MHSSVSAVLPLEFGTKAETLARLAGSLRTASILPQYSFTVAEWQRNPRTVLMRVCGRPWARRALIVRSSSRNEDQATSSNAGRYLSVSDVYGRDEIRLAVDAVIRSFDGDPEDQVLVQPQLHDALASGVVSSCEPSCGGPYRVVNWTPGTDTSEVTSGRSCVQTWYFLPGAQVVPPSAAVAGIPALTDELARLVGGRPFEFEFGVDPDGGLVLFQIRPLAGADSPAIPPQRHRAAVDECARRVRALLTESPPALGAETVLGVMPDWNPAEMIGLRPRPLALSLYRELITDDVWAHSRARYGYRDLGSTPLLVELHGLAYIDARASFTSFVPASVDEATARKLVTHYVRTLRENPHLHDKIEFAIALSSYDFTIPQRAERLCEEGVLDEREAEVLVRGLREVTSGMLRDDGPFRRDVEAIDRLAARTIVRPAAFSPRRLSALLDQCRRHGTLPFAGAARAAFAATALVRGLVELDVLTPADADTLLGSANTVGTALQRDFATLDRASFLRRYGHLRPGTYDILSSRYDEDPDRYFDWTRPASPPSPAPVFRPRPAQVRAVRKLLASHGLPGSPGQLFLFVADSIAAREYGKLQFSRLVSEILFEVRRGGERLGFTVDDMSHTAIGDLASLTGDCWAERRRIAELVERGRERYALTESLCAPAVLSGPGQLTSFVAMHGETNFVTQSRVAARVADIAAGDDPTGAIALIRAADPGYDWLFTKGIAGLVTAYGGANSHMAIRALELGIPAAIGVGENQFQHWLGADALEVDAAAKAVRPVTVAGHAREAAVRESRVS
ncbi:hypothetical protein LWP59_19220 [Amycolatopsis acidiphila]|uniref:Phosphoenolpyruvate synthase n=1 Tax=Amycolatopsis acidiphila TaxID=715473 RepID=A0A557ZPX1_9PSEU|nr:PEP-utilizing enzyme [Amycolatopsis acidiphila]TVT14048.1 phosphoenolpyruvate synthase [Amycolatopsis acidiphila]UIJ63608.1 hypothetical protein LWP59_19220 [Amycolatopsis acidiphila]GHG67961.1 hypothetical protein GCM10017788_27240 [Amycolatopsis acidiphila]